MHIVIGMFLALAVSLYCQDGFGHHNTGALFDLNDEIEVEGVVTRYDWKNPHVYFYVAQDNSADNPIEWEVEAGPVAFMHRFGWHRSSLKPGERIRFRGNPAKRGGHEAFLIGVIKQDGTPLPATRGRDIGEMFVNPVNDGSQADSLAGTWVTAAGEMIERFETAEALPLTAAAAKTASEFDEATMHPGLTCTPIPAPMMMTIPDTKEIQISADKVVIKSDFDGTERTIFLVEPEDIAPSIHGSSRGRLVNGSLHIETEHFSPSIMGLGFGVTSGKRKKLNERLTLTADRRSLTYWFEVMDAEHMTEPLSGEVRWSYQPNAVLTGLRCDPENAARFVKK